MRFDDSLNEKVFAEYGQHFKLKVFVYGQNVM